MGSCGPDLHSPHAVGVQFVFVISYAVILVRLRAYGVTNKNHDEHSHCPFWNPLYQADFLSHFLTCSGPCVPIATGTVNSSFLRWLRCSAIQYGFDLWIRVVSSPRVQRRRTCPALDPRGRGRRRTWALPSCTRSSGVSDTVRTSPNHISPFP